MSAIAKVRVCELLLQLGDPASARAVATEALVELGEPPEAAGSDTAGNGDGDGEVEGGGVGGGSSGVGGGGSSSSSSSSSSAFRSDHALAAFSVLARVNENEKRHEEAIRLFRICLDGYSAQVAGPTPSTATKDGKGSSSDGFEEPRGRLSELALEAARRLGYTLTAAGRPGEGAVYLQRAVDGWAERAERGHKEHEEERKGKGQDAESASAINEF